MTRFRIFKLPEYQKFNYRPLYYDAKKEALAQKRAQAAHENEENFHYRPQIKGSMRNLIERRRTKTERASKIRLLLIISILLAGAYFLLGKGASLEQILRAF